MSVFGNWNAEALAEAAEKSVAHIGDAELGAAYAQRTALMSAEQRASLIDVLFDAFRDRGEASQDAAEDAGTTLDRIEAGDGAAVRLVLDYAAASPGLLKEATMLFVERYPGQIDALPPIVADAMKLRLSGDASR